ncbi:hypothetical protein FSARC_9535 [Fusarium sarcochroum]|uniref:TLC domain-containing protein n=1 Tax=Fusarium sarcochroum TaxID=1208366 RepID=A0A8H4TR62_9HYPO|nr:hypothetical protein FSARC_9535 [Fusarium sarcochroum]
MPVGSAIIEERSKIAVIHNQPLTTLIPYGSFIITCNIVCIALLSNILERWVLRLVYRDTYVALEKDGNERRRRSFTYYHVGALVLFALLCVGVYPVFGFLVGSAKFDMPIGKGATLGDLLFLVTELYTAYYLYEMCFRTQFASPLTIAHHVGLLLITQTAVVLFADIQKHPQATIEFYMCMVWDFSTWAEQNISMQEEVL